jgi:hypothetical protein
MSDKDAFRDRERGLEDEYFRKKEKELIERLRKRRESETERQKLAEAAGVKDEQILSDLEQLGFTSDTVALLHIAPLVQVAWAEGNVSDRERELILKAAALRGIDEGSPAFVHLKDWLSRRPSEETFERILRVISALLESLPPQQRESGKADLLSYSNQIASVSGGFLGLGNKVSDEEEIVLNQIASELEKHHGKAAKEILESS